MSLQATERAARTHAEARALRLMGHRRRRYKRLPRQIPPRAIERAYAQTLVDLVVPVILRAFEPLLHDLPALLESARRERGDSLREDAGEGKKIRAAVAQAAESMKSQLSTARLEELAEKFAARTATYQRVQLGRQVRAAFGADVFIGDRALLSLVENFASENVSLIRSITTDVAARVERASIAAVQAGTLHGDLAKQLEKEFDYSESRAKLIARDQVGKLYGQINASRQKELGAESFIWRTVHDERVREEHDLRDGETYRYDDPPDGELPGEPILCRCYAEPVFPGMEES